MPPKLSSKAVLYAVVAVGIAIRVNQYFQRPALWLDEAMLALSIVNRPWYGLVVTPLYLRQTSSPLYLQLAHALTVVFGRNELALRFPSLLFSILSMILFAVLARRLFSNATAVATSAFFALSPMLVRYSAEVKPYAADVFAGLLLMFLALRMRDARFDGRSVKIFALGIGVAAFLSDVGILIAGGIGIALTCLAWREHDSEAWRAFRILAPFTIVTAILAAVGMHLRIGGSTNAELQRSWGNGFWPLLSPHSWRDIAWPVGTISNMFPEIAGIRSAGGLTLLIAAVGCAAFWRSGKRDAVALMCGMLLMALLASVLHLYPFRAARVSLWAAPLFIFSLGAGLEVISRAGRRLQSVIVAVLFAVFLMPQSLFAAWSTPSHLTHQNIPEVLAYVQAHRQTGDKIFAYWGAGPATAFYGPLYGIDPTDVIVGKVHRRDFSPYDEELAPLRGNRRVWVIFSHDFHKRERNTVVFKLDSMGRRLDLYPPQTVRTDAAAYLYDLTVPAATPP